MLFSVFFVASSIVSAPVWGSTGSNHNSHTSHTTTSNSKWRPWSGTTTTHTSTLSHQSGPHPIVHPQSHQPEHVVSHVPVSSAVAPSSGGGFNWGHAAVGAGAGIAGATLWNQQSQINDLKEQNSAAHGAAAQPIAVAAQPAPVMNAAPQVAVPASTIASAGNVASDAPLHSEKGQELILPTDDGPKIFEQKN